MGVQLPLFKSQSNWVPPEGLPTLGGVVALDFETKDPYLKTKGPSWCFPGIGKIVGAAVSSLGRSTYLPTGHEGGGNLPEAMVMAWLKEQAKDPNRTWVFANAAYDMGWARRYGIHFAGRVVDVLYLAALLDENQDSYSLDAVGERELNETKNYTVLKEALANYSLKGMDNLWRLPAHCVGEYAEQDAGLTERLYHHMVPKIREQHLSRVAYLEHAQIPILLDMRERGVRVNLDRAEQHRADLLRREREAIAEVKRLTGINVSPWASGSVASALIEAGAVRREDIPHTPKTGVPSLPADYLDTLDHPVAKLITEARRFNKTRSTFVEGYVLNHAVRGRVHCSFHPLRSDEGGTVGGRYSSSNFNLQNLPNPEKDPEMGTLVRDLFEPEEGHKWASIDYSSQEPRLTVHWAVKMGAPGAEKVANKYRTDPNTDYHQIIADLCGIARKPAKAINLGLAYGMGGAKLCHSLGLPTEWKEITFKNGQTKTIEVAGPEGQKLLDGYHEKVPFIKYMMDALSNAANRDGYITTLFGRRCNFPKRADGERWYTYRAMNRRIQGSAADQTKQAMVELHKEGFTILVTVHDENGLSVPDLAAAKRAGEIMCDCVPLEVPSKVDIAIGDTWGKAE